MSRTIIITDLDDDDFAMVTGELEAAGLMWSEKQ